MSGLTNASYQVGPGRTVVGDAIVAAHDGVERLDRADGDRRRRIAWRRDARITGKPGRRILAVVAGGGDDDHAGADGALDGLDERIGRRRFENRMSERQVDDLDAEARAVGHREVDRPNHVARVAGAVLVEHLQHDELHVGREAAVVADWTTARPIRRWFRRRACRARSRRTDTTRRCHPW